TSRHQDRRRFHPMAAKELKCRECGVTYALEACYVCDRCFGPLEVGYDHRRPEDPSGIRRRIQGGPQNIWRYADFLPLEGPPTPRRSAWTPTSSSRRTSRSRRSWGPASTAPTSSRSAATTTTSTACAWS